MDGGQAVAAGAVGAGLREMRERLGWKLLDVAEKLRIRLDFMQAIEAGDLGALPGPAYRTGFVRSYASLLGLDPEEILRRFREAGVLQDGLIPADSRFITALPDGGVPRGALVFLGVVVALLAYGFWLHASDSARRLAQEVPAVPPQLAPLAIPPKLEVAAVSQAAPATVVATVAASVAPPAPVAAPAPTPASQAEAVPAKMVNPSALPVPAGSTPVPAGSTPGAGMVISATADAWIEVSDATGAILFSKVLSAGQSWPVPKEPGLSLTTGNAGGTEIITNGVAGAPLGAPSTVLHNYELTPPAPVAAPSLPAPPAQTAPGSAP